MALGNTVVKPAESVGVIRLEVVQDEAGADPRVNFAINLLDADGHLVRQLRGITPAITTTTDDETGESVENRVDAFNPGVLNSLRGLLTALRNQAAGELP